MEATNAAISKLEQKLLALERQERTRFGRRKPEIFGANHHRYQRKPVWIDEIASLEATLKTAAPRDLAMLWAMIGSGVGPYYGLFGPSEILREIEDWSIEAAEVNRAVDLAGEFPITWPWDDPEPVRTIAGPTPGCLPIAHQGHTFWSALVLNGPEAGHVWDFADFGSLEWQWVPGRRPPGKLGIGSAQLAEFIRPPTLLEWYEGWLDQAIASIDLAR